MPRLEVPLYVGCYTDDAHPYGIHVLSLDTNTGDMRIQASYIEANVLYLALNSDGSRLYSCRKGGLAAYSATPSQLLKIADHECGGISQCHVALSPDGKTLNWVDYLDGQCGNVAIGENGAFGDAGVTVAHAGEHGPNLPRQDRSHCHCAVPTPDGMVAVCDLGLDQIVLHDPTTYETLGAFRTQPPGAGPRHILFHRTGRFAFVVFELGNIVTAYRYSSGRFVQLSSESLLDHGHSGTALAAAIRFAPDGRTLLVSCRGAETIVAFDFDEETGVLSLKHRTRLPGSWPRDFIFVSDDTVVAPLERSGSVVSFRYAADTAGLEAIGCFDGLHRPVCVVANMTAT